MTARGEGLLGACWHLLRTPVSPRRRGFLRVGWLVLLLFGLQVLTGTLLSLYYEPSEQIAAVSVQRIVLDVDSGWLVRGVHYWTTTALLALGLVHLLRVFVTGEYRGTRMALWYLGLLLFAVALATAFSGELLPWDDEAYWLLNHALEVIERFPLVGTPIANTLRGGEEITGYTLRRAHAIHILVLPGITLVLLALHLWLLGHRTKGDDGEGAKR